MPSVATLDFHVTSRCRQACPACTSPPGATEEVDTQRAAAIVRKVRALGVPRIVFTGGDPLLRPDAGLLLRLARQERLESVLATPGDALTPGFLRAYGRWIDQLAFPLDGPNEAVSSRSKAAGHFQTILDHLQLLAAHPRIDLKIGTAVTRLNLDAVAELVALLDRLAPTLPNRLSVDIYQVYPCAHQAADWDGLVVSDDQFADLRSNVEVERRSYRIRWLDRHALDGLRLTILPDGRLSAWADGQLHDLGPFVEIRDLEAALPGSGFNAHRHLEHAQTWTSRRREESAARQNETVAQ
jgi:MoaA/NifB/PqqE/SkfB family radical SAM enzyme